MAKLTPKQEAFVREYLVDFNGAAAYRRAGYKAATDHVASVAAAKLLANAGIADAIKEGIQARSRRTEVTADLVVAGLYKEATFDGEGSSHSARVAAWGWLGKHLAMFKDKHDHTIRAAVKRVEEMTDAEIDAFLSREQEGEADGGVPPGEEEA